MSKAEESWRVKLYCQVELDFPIPLLDGEDEFSELVSSTLSIISDELLSPENCIPLIEHGQIVDIIVPQHSQLQIGDLVTLNPISNNDFDFCFCRVHMPENVSYSKVLSLPDSDGNLVFECLSTGAVFKSGRQFWTKIETVDFRCDEN